jgi:hypothetical protein
LLPPLVVIRAWGIEVVFAQHLDVSPMREASNAKAINQQDSGCGPTYDIDTTSSISYIDDSTGVGSPSAMVSAERFPRVLPRAFLKCFQAREATGFGLACSGQPVIIERRERADCKLAKERRPALRCCRILMTSSQSTSLHSPHHLPPSRPGANLVVLQRLSNHPDLWKPSKPPNSPNSHLATST